MIADHKVKIEEEITLLNNICVSMSKKLKQSIEFTKDIHGIKFKNDLEDTLSQNIKNLIPANIYNYLLMSASMHNNLLCESLLRSTGIDVLSKFANCAFNQGSPGLVKMNLIINYEEKERMEEYKEIINI